MIPWRITVHDQDFYEVSNKGIQELRGVGTTLAEGELQILVAIDGRTTVRKIAERLGLSMEMARESFADLRQHEFIVPASARALAGAESIFSMPLAAADMEGGVIQASEQIDAGASALESSGYYVAITRRWAAPEKHREDSKYTVLIVDDDRIVLELLKYFLEHEGFLVRIAGNQEEIVAMLGCLPVPDLALIDVRMPGLDGFHVLARLHTHPIFWAMPVIMMTALSTREAVLKGLRLGAVGYVTKPARPEVLLRAVRIALGLEAAQ